MQITQEYPSPNKPWSPQAPSMHSNAVISQEAWKEGSHRTDDQKTWPNWKNHWTQAFNENRAIQCLTGKIFCANITIEDEFLEKMVLSLDNLANAEVQKNDTIEKLIDINKQQQETIHNLQAQNGELLTLLKHLSETPTTIGKQEYTPGIL